MRRSSRGIIGAMSRGTLLLVMLMHARPKRGERGATAVEYALIGAAIVVVSAFGIAALKLALAAYFAGQQDTVDGWVPAE